MPYERIVQWAAGPTAAIAGWLATQLVTNVHLFGDLGLGKDQLAHAIFAAVTFAITALLTYAAHQKWLTNLVKWWEVSGVAQPSGAPSTPLQASSGGMNGHVSAPLGPAPDQADADFNPVR
jgi:hypothetical protein